MSFIYFLLFLGFVLLLLLVFAWSLRKPKKNARAIPEWADSGGRHHVDFMLQVQQALSAADIEFLEKRGGRALANRVRKERKAVALAHLSALREDFDNIQRLAKAIAILSPEVIALEEFERLRLSLGFSWRCLMIHARLILGIAPAHQLSGLGDKLSGLTVQIEAAMRELGERAAIAARLASSLDGRDRNTV